MSIYIVIADVGLRVRSAPYIPAQDEKNNKIDLLSYGSEVNVLNKETNWFKVGYFSAGGKNLQGWVMSKYLDSKKHFLTKQKPNFKIGVPNVWNSINTRIVRQVIKDEFSGGKQKWDLQCTEYVLYKLWEKRIKVTWPVHSGRDGGKWGMIFQKFRLYRVSDTPTVGSAMCFTAGIADMSSVKSGHIAYVEKVFADGSILISEANVPNRGKYNERKLSSALWSKKYKAQFVDFTE